MNVADLVALDNSIGSPLEQELLDALAAFGFVSVQLTILKAMGFHVCYIIATRADGTGESWEGNSPVDAFEAQHVARDKVADWILMQPIPLP